MVKFFRGLKANYAPSGAHADGIYFATDTKELLMNGNAYGIPYTFDDSAIDARLDVLEGDANTEGSVAYQIAQIVAGADASFDTLKEIADWILSDTTGAAKMASDIAALQTAVGNIDYSGKADKVASATAGHFAGLDANGNLTDSGYTSSSFDASGAATTAENNAKAYADGLIAGLDSTKSQTAGTDGLALSISEVDGVITSISGSIAANTYDAYGAASAAQTAAIAAASTDATTKANAAQAAAEATAAADATSKANAAEASAKSYADGLLAWIEVAAA